MELVAVFLYLFPIVVYFASPARGDFIIGKFKISHNIIIFIPIVNLFIFVLLVIVLLDWFE
jgi:hypothetical protein